MTLARRGYRIVPVRTIEHGEDFYWTRFKVTVQDA
jgi:hypothetical protein